MIFESFKYYGQNLQNFIKKHEAKPVLFLAKWNFLFIWTSKYETCFQGFWSQAQKIYWWLNFVELSRSLTALVYVLFETQKSTPPVLYFPSYLFWFSQITWSDKWFLSATKQLYNAFCVVCLPANDIFIWTSFFLIEGLKLMHTSFLVAYHITSFMLYESRYTDVSLSVTPCF